MQIVEYIFKHLCRDTSNTNSNKINLTPLLFITDSGEQFHDEFYSNNYATNSAKISNARLTCRNKAINKQHIEEHDFSGSEQKAQ